MKNIKLLLSLTAMIFALFFATSCDKDDDDDDIQARPELGVNFNYTVEANVVTFTTTLTGNVWWTQGNTDYPAVDQQAQVAFAEPGVFTFTASTLSGGETLTSEPFDVEVLEGDPTMFDTPYWINLTNGYQQQKAWVLDVEGKLHSGPLSFMGMDWDFVIGDCDGDDCWHWDAPVDFAFQDNPANTPMEHPGEEGYGTMYFNLIDGKNFIADKTKEPSEEGTFDMIWDTRTITITGASILRSYKPFAEPDDVDGVVNGIEGISDWNNYRIFALTDSVLRVAVIRDNDVHGEGEAYLIYNFVEKELYNSIIVEPTVYVEPILTDFAIEDLVGTWKYAEVAQDWIGWPEEGTEGGQRLNPWNTVEEMAATLEGWGAENALETFQAAADNEYIFNADGTCVLDGIDNTYTLQNGVLTFGTELTSEFSLVWIGLGGTDVSVLDVRFDSEGDPYTPAGIWIGQKNGDQYESSSVQLVKVD